ncbi:MAG: hypothetical protein H5U01_08005, partial [Clostridia bacterium]|nr:hypothetical protein [Clostridia bacterium]
MRTGDLGFLHQGELFVTGRIKDMIIIHGVNVYPHDIEKTVQEADDRLRPNAGACFAVERDGREQLVIVQEVERRVKEGFDSIFQAIRRAVALEHELAVDAIILIKPGSIPRTSSNKIQRFACREAYLEGTLEVVAAWYRDQSGQEEPVAPLSPPAKTPEPTEAAENPEPVCLPSSGGNGDLVQRLAQTSDLGPAWQAAGGGSSSCPSGDGGRILQSGGVSAGMPSTRPSREKIIEAVLAEVRRVARDRAEGLTLDTAI